SLFLLRSLQEFTGTVAKFPFMSQDTPDAFFCTLPVAGVWPGGTVPVFRVFSNRVDANPRYMIDRTLRDQMAAMGWTIEGDGPDFVVMCAPPAPAAVNAESTMAGGMPMPPGYGGYGPP